MRISRYFACLFIITFLSLGYAHQHFLLIRTNYHIINYERQLSHLLDRNKKLMYNVAALESPVNLEAMLSSTGADYEVPSRWAVVGRVKSEPAYEFAEAAKRRNPVAESIMNFLAVKAEARAVGR